MVRVKACVALVTPTAVLGKVSVVPGVTVRIGSVGGGGPLELAPVPVRVRLTAELEALSVAVIVSVKVPADSGVKSNTNVQPALAARLTEVVQVLAEVSAKELLAGMVKVIVSGALPVLVKLKLCVALVWPMVVLAKVRVVLGETVNAGAAGVDAGPVVPQPRSAATRSSGTSAAHLRSMRSIGSPV